jgi:osmoprotectant transport system permease protein
MNTLASFFRKLGPEMLQRTYEHIFLVFFAMVIALAIALPLGVYLARTRWRRVVSVVLGASGVIQTVPGLALISFIVLLFALVSLPTIGTPPALVALVLYALLPILRNTYTGIRQVDPSLVEVARGMGMKPMQILFSVELPLSLPVIMAGIRISTVWTIGIATLCGLMGAGGLGDPILKGLRSIKMDYLLAGTVPAALLAVLADWLLGRLERWLTPEGIRESRHSQRKGA